MNGARKPIRTHVRFAPAFQVCYHIGMPMIVQATRIERKRGEERRGEERRGVEWSGEWGGEEKEERRDINA